MIRNFRPNKNVTISGMDRIRAQNVNHKVWDYLKRYQSSYFVEQKLYWEVKKNKTKLKEKSLQISSLMVQCEAYYKSVENAPMEIKPLLLYYGMIGLSKCLILAGDNKYTLSAMEKENDAHAIHGVGFTAKNNIERQIRDSDEILNEFCKVQAHGVYPLLRQCYSDMPVSTVNNKFTVKELLSLIPEFYKEFVLYFNEPPSSWHCHSHMGKHETTDTIQMIEFVDWDYLQHRQNEKEKYPDTINRWFPELSEKYEKKEGTDDFFWLKEDAKSVDDYIYVSDLMTLEQYALAKLNGVRLTDIDVHFLLMFILSNLVRYRQDKWAKLIRRQENDQIFLVESFVELSAQKFPLLILRELDNVNYQFSGQVATWG
jgi:hypothetical protein